MLKTNFLILLIIICCCSLNHAQEYKINQLEITKPVIEIIPSKIEIEKDTTQFITANVVVLNKGIGVLNIKSISGSCYCANGVIEKNDVYFLDTGKLRLEVNKEGLSNNDDTVIFRIESNAQNSSYYVTIKFVEKKKRDSHEK
jgi:hypothetical protein